MFLLCREKERLQHAKPFTRGTTATIGSNRGGPYSPTSHYAEHYAHLYQTTQKSTRMQEVTST